MPKTYRMGLMLEPRSDLRFWSRPGDRGSDGEGPDGGVCDSAAREFFDLPSKAGARAWLCVQRLDAEDDAAAAALVPDFAVIGRRPYEGTVILGADQRSHHGVMEDVMDLLDRAGVSCRRFAMGIGSGDSGRFIWWFELPAEAQE
jgi:hypothetical protein